MGDRAPNCPQCGAASDAIVRRTTTEPRPAAQRHGDPEAGWWCPECQSSFEEPAEGGDRRPPRNGLAAALHADYEPSDLNAAGDGGDEGE